MDASARAAPVDDRALPRVTFTDPEVGAVGLTEKQARSRLASVGTGSTSVPSTARGWIHKNGNEGLIKLVANMDRGIPVGATSMGSAGEGSRTRCATWCDTARRHDRKRRQD